MEQHLAIELPNDDELQFTLQQEGQLHVYVNKPWQGDSETGIGREVSVWLNAEQIKKVADFFKQLPSTQ